MNVNPFRFLLKYSSASSAFALLLISLCLVQFNHCYSEDAKWHDQQSGNSYNFTEVPSYYGDYSSQNASARDISAVTPASGDISKPVFGSNIVAYHRRLLNTSWAITIPLFTFLLPTANTGNPVDLGNQALYGFFAAVITIIGYAVPILFNGQIPGARSLENSKLSLNHLIHPGHLVNLVGLNIGNQIGIDPMQCLQKTVCEAYRSPQNERYGLLAWPFQYFFPAKNVSASEAGARSIYELAARDGKFTKTDCRKKYECMFDVLDLASYCLSVYKRSRKRAKAEEESNVANSNDNYYYYSNDRVNDFSNDKVFY